MCPRLPLFQVAVVDNAQYLQVLETSCEKSLIAVGSTLYELSGVDLRERKMGVVEMSPKDSCGFDEEADDAECFTCVKHDVCGVKLS